MAVKMIKVHGSGNDFYLLDQTQFQAPLSDADLKQLAINICKRDGAGLYDGADGVLVVDKSEHPQVLGRMRVINADRTEAACAVMGYGPLLVIWARKIVRKTSGFRRCMRT